MKKCKLIYIVVIRIATKVKSLFENYFPLWQKKIFLLSYFLHWNFFEQLCGVFSWVKISTIQFLSQNLRVGGIHFYHVIFCPPMNKNVTQQIEFNVHIFFLLFEIHLIQFAKLIALILYSFNRIFINLFFSSWFDKRFSKIWCW